MSDHSQQPHSHHLWRNEHDGDASLTLVMLRRSLQQRVMRSLLMADDSQMQE
jgi:hypothetical protein